VYFSPASVTFGLLSPNVFLSTFFCSRTFCNCFLRFAWDTKLKYLNFLDITRIQEGCFLCIIMLRYLLPLNCLVQLTPTMDYIKYGCGTGCKNYCSSSAHSGSLNEQFVRKLQQQSFRCHGWLQSTNCSRRCLPTIHLTYILQTGLVIQSVCLSWLNHFPRSPTNHTADRTLGSRITVLECELVIVVVS